jgi:putative MATE family efflux protein
VWDLAYPAIVTMVSQTIMWTVDSAMVGHVGKTELAAVGLGGLMVFTLYSFFIGLSYSINTYVSQSLGARNYSNCARYMWQGLYLGIASGAVILTIRHFNPWTIGVLGPAPEVRPLCLTYTSIRMLSGPFFILHYYYSNFFRGIGNTRTPMKVAIVANLTNIVIDYFLIFGKGPFPALGVAGAAWATFIANFLSASILCVISLSSDYRRRFGTHRHWQLRLDSISKLLKVGTPIGLYYVLDIGSFLAFSAYVGRISTEALAANQIIIQILALSFMPCNGLAVAATTLMGQYIGAGDLQQAKRSGYRALHLGLILTGFVALCYLLFSESLVRLFNDDPIVVSLGKRIILLAALFQLFDGVQIVVSGALRGAGDTKVPMLLALGGGWFLFLPLAYVFGSLLHGGVVGAWTGATIYVVFLGAGMFLRLKTDRWKRIKLAGIHDPARAPQPSSEPG